LAGESEQALRSVSDTLLNDLDRLTLLEQQKRIMKPEDPRTTELAAEVTEIASRVLSNTVVEEQITRSAMEAAEADAPDAPVHSIEETPRQMHTILEGWRAAERRAAAATPGTAEHAAAMLEAEKLRQEYQKRYSDRQRQLGRG
jgi:hypothetical protein